MTDLPIDPFDTQPSPETGQTLPVASQADSGGSMLRLRDVQVLNRSFRQLAEVQEALLDRLEELESERTSPRRWMMPAVAIACTVLGVGAAAVAMIQYQKAQPEIQVMAQAPEIVVQPTPVTVEVPNDPALREALQAFTTEVAAIRQGQGNLQEQNAALVNQLLSTEEEKLALLNRVAELEEEMANQKSAPLPFAPAPGEGDATGAPLTAASVAVASSADSNDSPWVGVTNGLFSSDGYHRVALREAVRVPDMPILKDAVWLEWNTEGVLDGVISAKRVEFALQQMTRNLVVTFFEGTRTRNGARIALPEKGLRLDFADVNPRPWLSHWPALAVSSAAIDGARGPGVTAASSDPETLRRALSSLMSIRRAYGYYRLDALGSVDGDILRMVQINWFDGASRLIKTIEADSMEIRLHATGSVELLLRGGALIEGGMKRPFYEDRFRLHLPRQALEKWRATGVPVTEVG